MLAQFVASQARIARFQLVSGVKSFMAHTLHHWFENPSLCLFVYLYEHIYYIQIYTTKWIWLPSGQNVTTSVHYSDDTPWNQQVTNRYTLPKNMSKWCLYAWLNIRQWIFIYVLVHVWYTITEINIEMNSFIFQLQDIFQPTMFNDTWRYFKQSLV